MKKLIPLVFIFCLIACENDDAPHVSKLRINHYLKPGTSEEELFTFMIQEDKQIGTGQWDGHGAVEGFEYEWGYIYDLEVKKEKLENPRTNGSSIKTTLLSVTSKQKVSRDTPFEIHLTWAYHNGDISYNYIRGDLSSGFTLLGSVAINCGNLCDELSQGLAEKKSLIGVFNHMEEGIQLIELK